MALRFSECEFTTKLGVRSALVITPTAHVRVGADRLTVLRGRSTQAPEMSSIDRSVLEEAERRSTRVQVSIFRGRDDEGTGSWDFAPDVREAQANELAYLMLRDQMVVYRALIRLGLCLHLHTDWSPLAVDAYRHATRRLIAELEDHVEPEFPPEETNPGRPPGARSPESDPADGSVDPVAVADLWILRNLTFFFELRLEQCAATLLPQKLPLMERRMERIRRMVAALPEDDDAVVVQAS